MTTEFIKAPNKESLERAGQILRDGGLVAFPTETVYGLGGNAYSATSCEKIFRAKGRPGDNPLIVHVADPADAEEFAYTNDTYYKLCERFAPGPLTIILPKKDNIPSAVTAGLDTVAVRCPAHPVALELIRAAGVPIAAPSANISGAPSPTSAEHVLADMNGKIEMIIDGGECKIGVESTVITLCEDGCVVLRPGDITPTELSEVVQTVYINKAVIDPSCAGDKPMSPGMKYRHYAPSASLVLISGSDEAFNKYVNSYLGRCAVMCFTEDMDKYPYAALTIDVGSKGDAKVQMHRLFSQLRETEGIKIDKIFAHLPPKRDEFLALYNRIIRAAGCEVINL